MAIMLDGRTTISPYRTVKVSTPSGSLKSSTTELLSVKKQIATKTLTTPLKQALTPVTKKVVVPFELLGGTTTAKKSLTSKLTESQKAAITQAVQLKYGQAVVSNPANQRMIALLRTRDILGEIQSSGYELAPKGTSDYLYTAEQQAAQFRDSLSILLGLQEEWTGKQAEYLSRISEHETVLAKSTQELGTLKAKYENLESEYLNLLNKPPAENLDLFGGLGDFIKNYGLWIALGVGAIILLPSILNIFGGKK